MVISESFVWGHVPKTGGTAMRAMFAIFGELVQYADPSNSVQQHTPFRDREEQVRGKKLALNLRRLPSWILSREHHKAQWGLHPDYVPVPMDTPDEMASSSFPDFRLGTFLDEGRFEIDHWLRTEVLTTDFLAFISEYTSVSEEQRRQVMDLDRLNSNKYDRELDNWFTADQIERLYASNPVWAGIEEKLHGGLLVGVGH